MKVPSLLFVSFSVALLGSASAQFVTVGNPGNPNDPSTLDVYGAVATTYAIGTYEVTLNQYAAFLNAKAAADPLGLYNPSMGTDLNSAGISRTGVSGSYVYGIIGDGQRPVTYVTFYDAMRYANWLHNGGGSGSTETGAYTLLGGTPSPSNGTTVTRNGGAQVWVPSQSEWHKAAYYDPTAGAGGGDNYWRYPTQSDAVPNSRNGSVSDTNSGNFYGLRNPAGDGVNDGFAVTGSTSYSESQNYLTAVGAYTQADSYYGTFDQGGNVYEWTETISFSTRGYCGGSWRDFESYMRAANSRTPSGGAYQARDVGFRVATVPEPTVSVGLMLAGGLLLAGRKRPSAL